MTSARSAGRAIGLAVAALAGAGCAGTLRLPEAPSGAGAFEVRGRVTYERRFVGERGLSRRTEVRPARLVHVAALVGGEAEAVAYTGEQGDFTLRLARPDAVQVIVSTVSVTSGHDVRVLVAPWKLEPHRLRRDAVAGPPGAAAPVHFHATVGGEERAGAFHILDRLVLGIARAQRSLRREAPPLVAFWRRGNTRDEARTSFYRDESVAIPGGHAVQFMGGDPVRPDQSDSDQFDDSVILHELGHFIAAQMGVHYPIGGDHTDLRSLVPGAAWEEGFADFFSAAVIGSPIYLDSEGVEPVGRILVRSNLESTRNAHRGADSQATVFELLWDVADGVSELRDRDGDGIAIGLDGVLRVIATFDTRRGDYPYIGLFLERAVAMGLISDAEVAGLLRGPPPHEMTWPLAGRDRWPADLPVPGTVEGLIDGLGARRTDPRNGASAVRVYRIHLRRAADLGADLVIDGSGRIADRQDLDLELYDARTHLLASSRTEASTEAISESLPAGFYYLYARDGGNGNRAAFRLEVTAD